MGSETWARSKKRKGERTSKNGLQVVINTNILFSYFNKKSATHEILTNPYLELTAPFFALEELDKYAVRICEKNNLLKEQYDEEVEQLKQIIHFKSLN